MKRNKKNIFIKISAFVSVMALAIASVVVPTYAYSYNTDSNTLASDNILAVESYSNLVSYDTGTYIYPYRDDLEGKIQSYATASYNYRYDLTCYIYNSSDTLVQTLGSISCISSGTASSGSGTADYILSYNAYANTPAYWLTKYDGYYFRFQFVSNTSSSGTASIGYVQYEYKDMLNFAKTWWSSEDYTTTYVYLLLHFDYSYGVGGSGYSIALSNLGVYCSDDSSVADDDLEYNGVWRNSDTSKLYDYSYNQGVASQQGIINGLQQQVDDLTEYINNMDTSSTQTNMQTLLWTVAATPWESFKTIWDVDVLGINISGIVLGGLTALIVIYLIKKFWR